MNPRQLLPPVAVVLAAFAFSVIAKAFGDYTSQLFLGLGFGTAVYLLYVSLSQQQAGPKLTGVLSALRAVAKGKRPPTPDDATGELADVYKRVEDLFERHTELAEEVQRLERDKGGVDVEPILEAMHRVGQGERVRPPPGTPAEVARVYADLSALSERITQAEQREKERVAAVEQREKDRVAAAEQRERDRVAAAEQREKDNVAAIEKRERGRVETLLEAVERAAQGERVRPPAGAPPETVQFYASISALTDRVAAVELRERERIELVADAVDRAGQGERVRPPSGSPSEVTRVFSGITTLTDRMTAVDQRDKQRRTELTEAALLLEDLVPKLGEGLGTVIHASEQATVHIRDVTGSLSNIAQSIEMLATSAEESSSSILEMTATSDEVAENVGELGASVRETVSSIEEMAYSIREVAKNVDGLALTAEETSSSMNQMDVSIDQVQSNANETARLSEEVATDAEKGAEAILKTISEIYRIKESSQEAVSVISNLGFRIEAIGQILSVIDDVADQTNLLALNAAIIAAQAGEHGKGFAVVADEIKDLAERVGGSTKEIAELIKTIQAESKNAIAAVERGAHNVDRGVEVSNEAERALKKILDSSQKSTNMVRAIARATVEQAKGSKQVTEAIQRIADTVQQIAAATAEQSRGSDLIMKSADKMRTITQHVERSSQEQTRGGRQMSNAIEQISNMVTSLNTSQRSQSRGGEQLFEAARRIEEAAKAQEQALRHAGAVVDRLRRALAS
jgi:methyl-accepting chemotaxis protein